MNVLNNFLNKITCGDCLSVMRGMPSNSIDLVVTSPPYNLKNSTGNGMKAGTKTGRWANNPLQNGYAHHNDEMPHNDYVVWQQDCSIEREDMELTEKQIKRQDFVDNEIYNLIRTLNPSDNEIDWDIEMIGEVRDCLQNWIIEKTQTEEMNFYPFVINA